MQLRAVYESRIEQMKKVTATAAAQFTTVSPYAAQIGARLEELLTTTRGATVFTDATGAYVSVAAGSWPRRTPTAEASPWSDEQFWRDLASLPSWSAPPTLQSVEIKDYDATPALALHYTGAKIGEQGPFVFTVVRFYAEGSAVTFMRAALASNPDNGLEGFEAILRSFRFDK